MTRLKHYIQALRAAIEAAGRLRAPGGDVVDGLLSRLETGDRKDAVDVLAPLLGDSALSDIAHLLSALLLDAENRREAAEAIRYFHVGREFSSVRFLYKHNKMR